MPLKLALGVIEGKCNLLGRPNEINTYFQATASVLTDCILVLLPLPSVLSSHFSWKTQISIGIILLLGIW
jgi:hypothetical protein